MVFGESVNLPMRVVLNTLAEEYRPHSSSASFSELWSGAEASEEFMVKVFNQWRTRSITKNDPQNTAKTSLAAVINCAGECELKCAKPKPN